MNEALVRQFLSMDVHPLRAQVDARHVEALIREYAASPGAFRPAHDAQVPPEVSEARNLFRFLTEQVESLRDRLERLEVLRVRYLRRSEVATHPRERNELVMDFARELGATQAELRGDRRALRRHFDLGAVLDRCEERKAGHEQLLALVLRRLRPLGTWLLERDTAGEAASTWGELDLERLLLPLLSYQGDVRVRMEAFRALLGPLSTLPRDLHQGSLSDQIIRLIFRAAIGREDPVWVQREALSFLPELDPEVFTRALTLRLQDPAPGDDFFLRCRGIGLLGEHFARVGGGAALLRQAAADPSPRVRQRVAEVCSITWEDGGNQILAGLIQGDLVPAVRAASLLALQEPALESTREKAALDLLAGCLEQERDAFVVRTALHVLEHLGERLQSIGSSERMQALLGRFLPILEQLHACHASLGVRRWAAQTREYLWCRGHAQAREILLRIQELQLQIPEGGHRAVPDLEGYPETLLGRVLSHAARRDFGLSLGQVGGHLHLMRGEPRRFRLWRFLHEFRNPDPAKRQGHAHTIGRVFRGGVRAHSGILGELAETKVPGEPLFIPTEAGWRPYLPLPDEAVSLLESGDSDGRVRIYTAEGVTELEAPSGLRKWKARFRLAAAFPGLARLRNWQEADVSEPSAYLQELERHGFRSSYRPYGEEEGLATGADSAVQRFFPALAVPSVWNDHFRNLQDYFYSAYGNTLTDLLIFAVGTGVWFFGKNLARHQRMRYHRRRIPLVIGGWGTRGKSGTERLKAALFSGLGYGVVSKTTGCESMFLYGKPFQDLKEMFLFRPYDKVSIQEQTFVVRMASKLHTDVFLWECMALSPTLVQVLQGQWMKDDLSTLTNAFPDHEDVQGPAGHDIPRVMTNFIPEGRTLYTAEENMLPILADSARAKGTRLRGVTWLESGLLTEDVMARFPYQEHPDNVALVMAIAEDFGVDPDFALKEMADRVVADLGVLKTFPDARIRGRRLRFTNGMSANEPFGALGNWNRVGFTGHDPDQAPGEWISAVVNNRADRVARSQVFAQLMAESLLVDRFFLIGGNLTGLQGYVRDAFRKVVHGISLGEDRHRAAGILSQSAQRYRIPATSDQVRARVAAMLQGLGAPLPEALPDLGSAEVLADLAKGAGLESWLADLEKHRAEWVQRMEEYCAFEARLRDEATPPASLDGPFRELLKHWFDQKFVVVEDFFAPGDKVIDILASATPPGYLNRCMGIQNIKGTGLDFIYRFLAWDRCHEGCRKLLDPEMEVARKALQELLAFKEFGVLSEQLVNETLNRCASLPAFRDPETRADLDLLKHHFETQMNTLREAMSRSVAPSQKDRLLALLENLLDTQDSLRRSWQAKGIYRDLLKGQISRARAVEELRRLTKRQYGGWLQGKV